MQRILAVLILSILLFSVMPLQSGGAVEYEYVDTQPRLVLENEWEMKDIACWENHIVWYYNRPSGNSFDEDIVLWDEYTRTMTNITYLDGNRQLYPAIGPYGVVWSDNRNPDTGFDIYFYSFSTKSTMRISSNPGDDIFPRTDGDLVVYENYPGSGVNVIVRNLLTGDVVANFSGSDPDISGRNVVYYGSGGWYVYNLDSHSNTWVAGPSASGVKIDGDYITYYEGANFGSDSYVFVHRISDNSTTLILRQAGYPVEFLDIYGGFVAWSADNNTQYGGEGAVVYLYDIQAQKVIKVSPIYERIFGLSPGGGRIAWIEGDQYYTGPYRIWAADLPEPGPPPENDDTTPSESPEHLALRLKLDCPADLLIKDGAGNMLGYLNGQFYEEIPGGRLLSDDGETEEYWIDDIQNIDDFSYMVAGTGEGTYNLYVTEIADTVETTMSAIGIEISEGTSHLYSVDWQKAASGAIDSTTIWIDENGDGTFEKSTTTGLDVTNQDILEAKENGDFLGMLGYLGPIPVLLIAIILLVAIIAFAAGRRKAKPPVQPMPQQYSPQQPYPPSPNQQAPPQQYPQQYDQSQPQQPYQPPRQPPNQ